MRHALLPLALLAACASAPPSDSCPCAASPAGGFGYTNFGASVFADTDNDGLPDTRLPTTPAFADTDGDGLPDARAGEASSDATARRIKAEIAHAYRAVRDAINDEQLTTALDALAVAVAAARNNLPAR